MHQIVYKKLLLRIRHADGMIQKRNVNSRPDPASLQRQGTSLEGGGGRGPRAFNKGMLTWQ